MFGAQLGRLIRMIERLGCEFIFCFSHSAGGGFGVLVLTCLSSSILLIDVNIFSDYVKMWEMC